MITVCKDCPKRHVGCHGECTLYKTERRLLDKENARKRAENAAFDSVSKTWNGECLYLHWLLFWLRHSVMNGGCYLR